MKRIPVLKVNNVTKKIHNKTIVENLSFKVYAGEVFGLLGPNGAGKTTLIRMIVGLMGITEGDIMIHDFSIKTQFEQAVRGIGAVVENPELYQFMSGYKNLVHFARMTPGVDQERIDEVVSLVRLENRIHDPVKTYSLGMRQRLGLAQAILHRPSLLILDEPTNGLDPAGIRELRDYLRELAKKENVAVLVSSHLLSEMELMCDRVGIIRQGKLAGIRSVGKLENQKAGMFKVHFEVDSVEKIPELLKKKSWNKEWAQVPGGFEIELKREQIAELNARMTEAGIKVYGIRTMDQSLEDKYLEMTEGDEIA
ncbi:MULTISPECIES: ABC transporter ATP-binding protein [Thermoactinomyces]|jgi:ABC-2 type transport system ATP-binding protein|uniref:ABC transporter ATP-binding protein n=1 Tax=Thermoactinomyces daqus TaxID=1329516 RepID=A0A7W1X7U3_9BACL|nr:MULTISPECIES: ABC transporter ATP-binding protein [Thermoactinomyces]MBA4541655.1 ABC transporter ATP-binding protein [Thermoactinomyces daqus]MBH8597652.1 ABC transporter ATP-binding protein [Thermoactinomyces sp. CICC 10523]